MKIVVTIISLLMSLAVYHVEAQNVVVGSCSTRDGGKYQGEIVANKPHGKGKVVYPNGDVYEGQFVKGKRNGKGVFSYADGRPV